MNVQTFMGMILCLVLCMIGLTASAGGNWKSIDLETGQEIRGVSTDNPESSPIPFPTTLGQQKLKVLWNPIETSMLGTKLILSGRLLHFDKSKKAVPLCNQPFSIYLARRRERHLDWSKKALYDETSMLDGFSDENGNFEGSVQLSETDLSLAKIGNVQVAIAAASIQERGRERWVIRGNHRPAISTTVTMLKLPSPPELAPATLELIRLLRWPHDDLDGTQLLRTAIALQASGKDAALDAIDTFVEGRIGNGEWQTSDFEDECIVGMITHLVFEPKEGSPSPPSYICLFGFDWGSGGDALRKQWPNGAVMFAGGVPFVTGWEPNGSFGSMLSLERFPEWIKQHGQIRNQSFLPTIDPLSAADKLLNAPFIKAITDKDEDKYVGTTLGNHIRRQALAMIGLPVNPEHSHYAGPVIPDELWGRLIEELRSNPIEWDPELQRFDAKRNNPRFQQLIKQAIDSIGDPCDE